MRRKQAIMQLMDATLVIDPNIENVAQWCRVNGVNPRTFYRHRARIRAEGSWQERSRRPGSSPSATPQEVVDAVLAARSAVELGPDNGADSIRALLLAQAAGEDWAARGLRVPARATINRILDRHALLAKNPAKRPRASWRSFGFARPRDCYQIDGTAYRLADTTTVIAIDIIDDCTRRWVASHVAPGETTEAALAAIAAAHTEAGLPGLVLADNGTAWAHPHRYRDKTRSSAFSRALAEHGTRVIHSSPYHPQTCGKVERLHHTAAKLLDFFYDHPAADPTELQTRLDTVRAHYNTVRRHSSIGRITPQQAWHNAGEHGGPADLPRQTDATVHVLRVGATGTVSMGNHLISIGRDHSGQTVTALRNNDHVTVYTTSGEPLGHTIIDPTRRYQGALTPHAAA